jgi:hypothetical protein
MKIVLNGINGNYLRDILEGADGATERIDAAVAYATDASTLFQWALERDIPTRFWGRCDEGVAVSVPILKGFLDKASPNYSCRLVRHHHAKVIWWHGYGAYIGSANLTQKAWWSNAEAGVFVPEADLEAAGQDLELDRFFTVLDSHASTLTREIFEAMERRAKVLEKRYAAQRKEDEEFSVNVPVNRWDGLTATTASDVLEQRKSAFLSEWSSTLQQIRDLAREVSKDENRPAWIDPATPIGAQADQFLHAHYYQRTFEHRMARYEEHFLRNRGNPALAVREALHWWHALPSAPTTEAITLNSWAPFLRDKLSKDSLSTLSETDLADIFERVHAIRDHARRVGNAVLGLQGDVTHDIPEKTCALAGFVFRSRTERGATVIDTLKHVLYGGPSSELPERLWDAVNSPTYRIEHFGISALGELVGWALPDTFPPRNGRTSKALRSLGYDVRVHSA